jgi:hypothetical protein
MVTCGWPGKDQVEDEDGDDSNSNLEAKHCDAAY